ncbi:MAG: hypothetical protein PHP23_15755 [Desulfobacterales bacterium]|nr:hypothetical protein [Desulfobacterales bacterium]
MFIRGVDSRKGPDFGIYHEVPPAGLIEDLGKAMIPGFRMESIPIPAKKNQASP